MTQTEKAASNWLQKLAAVLVVLVVLGWVFRDFLWKLIQALMLNFVPILFTPVILELTVAFVGLFIVLLFCFLRRKDREDEWVYISQVEPESEMEPIPEPLRQRVGDTVIKSKPLEVDPDELPLESIEGLIELGVLDEAQKELAKASPADQRHAGFVRLKLLVLLRQENWAEAVAYTGKGPAAPDALAHTCVEAARFFVKQKPAQKDAAKECLELGKNLSVNAVVNAIDSDGKLQKLA